MFNCTGDIELKFPFYLCNFYTNSSPVLLDEIQFEQYRETDNMLITSLSSLFSLLLVELPHCDLSQVEKCILNKYDLTS